MITRSERQNQRDQGLQRSNGKSELSEKNGYVEASHLDHDKREVQVYLSPDTVVMCTPLEHYAYHLLFKGKAGYIGLDELGNDYAIRECYKRACYYMQRHWDIDFDNLPREEKKKHIAQAWNYWSYYLELPFFEES